MTLPAQAAVIDIGSNSIKILIARRDEAGQLQSEHYRTLDARISKGISGSEPRLSDEGIQRGLEAVQDLLGDARQAGVTNLAIVATSAVRDASNGAAFAALIEAQTGHPVRILTGEQEANLIGLGLTCDPALSHLNDFYLFDLGGGSLELLSYRDRRMTQAISLPLGCVRLTELFVVEPEQPFPPAALAQIRNHTQNALRASGFQFNLPPSAAGIGTGGTVTTARTVFAARAGKTLAEVDAHLTVDQMRELLSTTTRSRLEDRIRLPGMPPKRADVFPTALATLIAVCEVAGLLTLQNSIYNLRWGLVSQMLSSPDHR